MGEILDESLCHLPIAWRHGWGLFSLNSFCNENSMNPCLLLVLALSLFSSSSSLSLGFVLGYRSRVVSAEYEDFSLFFHFFFKEKTASIWFTWNPWSTVGFFFSFFGCFLLGLSKHLGAWVLICAGSTSRILSCWMWRVSSRMIVFCDEHENKAFLCLSFVLIWVLFGIWVVRDGCILVDLLRAKIFTTFECFLLAREIWVSCAQGFGFWWWWKLASFLGNIVLILDFPSFHLFWFCYKLIV